MSNLDNDDTELAKVNEMTDIMVLNTAHQLKASKKRDKSRHNYNENENDENEEENDGDEGNDNAWNEKKAW